MQHFAVAGRHTPLALEINMGLARKSVLTTRGKSKPAAVAEFQRTDLFNRTGVSEQISEIPTDL
jgi:hypothetical protein